MEPLSYLSWGPSSPLGSMWAGLIPSSPHLLCPSHTALPIHLLTSIIRADLHRPPAPLVPMAHVKRATEPLPDAHPSLVKQSHFQMRTPHPSKQRRSPDVTHEVSISTSEYLLFLGISPKIAENSYDSIKHMDAAYMFTRSINKLTQTSASSLFSPVLLKKNTSMEFCETSTSAGYNCVNIGSMAGPKH